MQTIKLQWRRGGGWKLTEGWWFWRNVDREWIYAIRITPNAVHSTEIHCDYAGPFALEEEGPEPEMLRIEGCSEPEVRQFGSVYSCYCYYKDRSTCAAYTTGATRRQAIERYNALAKMMGAKE